MKCKTLEPKKPGRLPEVGEVWKHKNFHTAYMRIDDEQGKKALAIGDSWSDRFYSVDLSTGHCVHTTKDRDDVVVLVPAGGEVTFVPA